MKSGPALERPEKYVLIICSTFLEGVGPSILETSRRFMEKGLESEGQFSVRGLGGFSD